MVLKRLLPGRRSDSATNSAPVTAEQLAAAWETLATASTSATWKCRHANGSMMAEGTVDFSARESRATVIRGRATYEYLRRGSTAFRAPVREDQDADAEPNWEYASETDACGIHAYAIPEVIAAAVRAAGPAVTGRTEEFDEKKLTVITVTVKPKPSDTDGRLARLARQLRDHGAIVLLVTALVDPQAWDDEADEPAGTRIERLRLELPHWTPADNPMDDHSVVVDLFDLNEPVEIAVPEESAAERRRTVRGCADLALF